MVTVINNNSALSQDQRGDERAYAGMEGGHPEELWSFTDTNFAAVAESIGCFGIRVERPGDIQSAPGTGVCVGPPRRGGRGDRPAGQPRPGAVEPVRTLPSQERTDSSEE